MSGRIITVPRREQRGFSLIEVMIALLVFMFGVMGLMAVQGNAVRFSSDAQQRADATFLADQLLGRMLISDPATIAAFDHHGTGTAKCAPVGGASANAVVLEWLDEVANLLPKAAENLQQVAVNPATGEVRIRLCWQQGDDPARELVIINQVQWQP